MNFESLKTAAANLDPNTVAKFLPAAAKMLPANFDPATVAANMNPAAANGSANALNISSVDKDLTAYSEQLVGRLRISIDNTTGTIKEKMISVIENNLNKSKEKVVASILEPTRQIANILAQQLDGTNTFQIFIYALLKDNFELFKNAIIETFDPINNIDEPIVYNKITINDIKNINKIIDNFKTKLYDKLQYSSKEKHGGGKNNRKPLIRSVPTNSSKPTKYIKKRNSRSSRKRSRNFTKKHNSRSSRKRSKNFTKKNTH